MPDNAHQNKPSLAKNVDKSNVNKSEETRRSSPADKSRPVVAPDVAHDRRTRARRIADAEPIDSAMDVALGTEDEAWDRRRSPRRKNAA